MARTIKDEDDVIGVGHNSKGGVSDVADTGIAHEELKQFVERIENLEEEKKAIADDIKDVYAEAKARGFDTKIMRQVIMIRRMERAEREEREAILELYLSALGMA